MGYIEMQHSYKRYHMGNSVIEANRDVSFSIEKGELAMILGSSARGNPWCCISSFFLLYGPDCRP